MQVSLRERYLDVVLVQRIIDTLHDLALCRVAVQDVDPEEHLQRHATIVETLQANGHGTVVIDAFELRHRLGQQAATLLDIGAIGHADLQRIELVAMVFRKILIVLGEEL